MPDMKLQDMKLTDQIARHENARHENAGHEIAKHDKYRTKIDCITVQCAFLLNFKSFFMYGERVNVENLTAPAHHKYIAVFSNLYTWDAVTSVNLNISMVRY